MQHVNMLRQLNQYLSRFLILRKINFGVGKNEYINITSTMMRQK